MRSLFTILTILFLVNGITAQQEYKVSLSSGKIIILDVNKTDIEGHNGTDIIITGKSTENKDDDRRKGLLPISGTGLKDNTGMGLSVVKEGNEVTIEQISKKAHKGRFKIKVPNNVAIYYEHGTHDGSGLNIKNVKSEIEVTAHFNDVYLEGVTGPMSINTIHGDIDAVFSTVSQKNPITIRSTHGHVDVSMPPSTKADIKLASGHGEMFTDFDIKMAAKTTPTRNTKGVNSHHNYSSRRGCHNCDKQKVIGNINGGGVLVELKTSHSNIYFRKKK